MVACASRGVLLIFLCLQVSGAASQPVRYGPLFGAPAVAAEAEHRCHVCISLFGNGEFCNRCGGTGVDALKTQVGTVPDTVHYGTLHGEAAAAAEAEHRCHVCISLFGNGEFCNFCGGSAGGAMMLAEKKEGKDRRLQEEKKGSAAKEEKEAAAKEETEDNDEKVAAAANAEKTAAADAAAGERYGTLFGPPAIAAEADHRCHVCISLFGNGEFCNNCGGTGDAALKTQIGAVPEAVRYGTLHGPAAAAAEAEHRCHVCIALFGNGEFCNSCGGTGAEALGTQVGAVPETVHYGTLHGDAAAAAEAEHRCHVCISLFGNGEFCDFCGGSAAGAMVLSEKDKKEVASGTQMALRAKQEASFTGSMGFFALFGIMGAVISAVGGFLSVLSSRRGRGEGSAAASESLLA